MVADALGWRLDEPTDEGRPLFLTLEGGRPRKVQFVDAWGGGGAGRHAAAGALGAPHRSQDVGAPGLVPEHSDGGHPGVFARTDGPH